MSTVGHAVDGVLLEAVRCLPRVTPAVHVGTLFARAEHHGLAGVLLDAWQAAGVALPREVLIRDAARSCDHAAHLAMLHRIDAALTMAGVPGVALKGALLAERLYPRPAARPTTDIDLLVDEDGTACAVEALSSLGYRPYEGPEEEHFRRRGHHLHLLHPSAPQLELHFHAYRGFGAVLRSAPFLERSNTIGGFRSVRSLCPEDELVYLAVHAAGHRLMRLGWLYDVVLLIRQNPSSLVAAALARASALRMVRPLSFVLERVRRLFGVDIESPEVGLASGRHALLSAIVEEPERPVMRSLTRFAYSLALCEDAPSAGRYVREALAGRWSRHATG